MTSRNVVAVKQTARANEANRVANAWHTASKPLASAWQPDGKLPSHGVSPTTGRGRQVVGDTPIGGAMPTDRRPTRCPDSDRFGVPIAVPIAGATRQSMFPLVESFQDRSETLSDRSDNFPDLSVRTPGGLRERSETLRVRVRRRVPESFGEPLPEGSAEPFEQGERAIPKLGRLLRVRVTPPMAAPFPWPAATGPNMPRRLTGTVNGDPS